MISCNECILQMFFFHFIAGAMVFFLLEMEVDQYMVIYKPLRHLTVMNPSMCVGLVALAWLGGLAHSSVQIGLILQLLFCGPNVLDNFYCVVPQAIKLAYTDTYRVELQMDFSGGMLLIILFIILPSSYTIILVKIRTHITDGKCKAVSTCRAQVTVVSFIFVHCIFVYTPPFNKFTQDKVVTVIYTVITLMLNPMIYMLRKSEMKAIKRPMSRFLLSV